MPGPIRAAGRRLPVAPTTAGYALAGALALAIPLVLGEFGLYLAAVIATAAIYGVAYDVAYGYTGLLSFGHAVFFGTGAYAAALAVRDLDSGGLAAVALGVVAATAVALLVGWVAVRVSEHGFVILTIIFVLLANLLAVSFSSVTGGTDGFTVAFPALLGVLDPFDPAVRYYVVLLALGATLLVLRRLLASPVGLAFRMIDDNERRARLLGYDAARYKLTALAISGGFSGLAGALDAMVVGYAGVRAGRRPRHAGRPRDRRGRRRGVRRGGPRPLDGVPAAGRDAAGRRRGRRAGGAPRRGLAAPGAVRLARGRGRRRGQW